MTNVQGDRRGEGLALELSLAEDVIQPGGAVRGAVAISGLRDKTLRRVEAALVATEAARVVSAEGAREVDRRVWVLREGTPPEGEATRFDLGVPTEMPTSFATPFIEVTHHLEVMAVVAWGRDVTLALPLQVAAGAGGLHGAAVPIVGRARNVAVWQEAVHGVAIPGASLVRFDADQGQVVFAVQGVKVVAREELRDDAPCMVAEVTFAPLGLELRVAERSWIDFGARLDAIDEGFQRRFTVRAREAAQAAAVLDGAVCAALSRFDESALDDDGAVVMRRGGVFQLDGLQSFLAEVAALGGALARVGERVPPPDALKDRRRAFEAFAAARGARLRVGDLALHGWPVKGVVVSARIRWEGSHARAMLLETPLPEGADHARWRDALAGVAELRGGVARQECEVPRDPAALLPMAERLADAALLAQREGDAGPYRR